MVTKDQPGQANVAYFDDIAGFGGFLKSNYSLTLVFFGFGASDALFETVESSPSVQSAVLLTGSQSRHGKTSLTRKLEEKSLPRLANHVLPVFLIPEGAGADTHISDLVRLEGIAAKNGSQLGLYRDDVKYSAAVVGKGDAGTLKEAVAALSRSSLKERYSSVYDSVCARLDESFRDDPCGFDSNDQCEANRKGLTPHAKFGCCWSYDASGKKSPKRALKESVLCAKLDGKRCREMCMACKLYTCAYLKEKGLKFEPEDFALLTAFFSRRQRIALKRNFFRRKSDVIKKLLEIERSGFWEYMNSGMYMIKGKRKR